MNSTTRIALPALAASALLALTGCASATPAADDDTLRIVATTNVYADIAQTVAGDRAEVTAIIADVAQDPHEYEATSRDALAFSEADLVVMNGGGYDEFATTILAAQDAQPVVLDAVEISGVDGEEHDHEHEGEEEHADEEHADEEHAEEEGHEGHDHGAYNEHVWYDVHAMGHLAHDLAHELAELDPEGAEAYEANAEEFEAGIAALEERLASLQAAHEGEGVAVTEPVALYLLEDAGLVDLTPSEFSEAIEEGSDAPVLVLEQTIALVSGDEAALLAYNEQTVSAQTEQVLDAAEGAGTPVVSFSELMPEGTDYLAWMGANVDAVEAALS